MAALLRCGVCAERLSEDDFASSLCRFHVGAFGATGASGSGSFVWRCCNAAGESAPGCAAGCHVRDDTQPAQQPAADGDGSGDDDDARGCERGDADEAAAPCEPFVNIILAASDTLAGVAMRYNTTPGVRAALLCARATTDSFEARATC